MIRKLLSLFKMTAYKLRYFRGIHFCGFQTLSFRSKLVLSQKGKMILNKVSAQENVYISTVGGCVTIGKGVSFNRNCIIVCREKISIDDDCIFGPNVTIYDHDHIFDSNSVKKMEYNTGEVVIEKGCWIGAGVIILRNTHIGAGSVIGAGAIIKGDIPSHSIVTAHHDLHINTISDRSI